MNIVELITSQLGDGVLSKLSGQIGASETQTKSAVSAAVPALLGTLGKLAGTPAGAKQLSSAMEGMDLGMLGNLVSAFTGRGASKTGELGGKLLASLLGGSGTSSLVSSLASLIGLNSGITKTLLGFLAPVVLGTIAKQFKGTPDPAGLTRFFSEQQSNISGALPRGFSLVDNASTVATAALHKHAPAVPKSSGIPSWLPLAALLALASALGYYFLSRPATELKDVPVARETPALPAEDLSAGMDPVVPVRPEVMLPEDAPELLANLPIGKELSSLFGNLTTTLSDVTDVATAQEALPKLQGYGPTLEAISGLSGNLTAEQKGSVGKMVIEQMGPLQKIIDTVMALPGVRDILGPVVLPMIESISKLAS